MPVKQTFANTKWCIVCTWLKPSTRVYAVSMLQHPPSLMQLQPSKHTMVICLSPHSYHPMQSTMHTSKTQSTQSNFTKSKTANQTTRTINSFNWRTLSLAQTVTSWTPPCTTMKIQPYYSIPSSLLISMYFQVDITLKPSPTNSSRHQQPDLLDKWMEELWHWQDFNQNDNTNNKSALTRWPKTTIAKLEWKTRNQH